MISFYTNVQWWQFKMTYFESTTNPTSQIRAFVDYISYDSRENDTNDTNEIHDDTVSASDTSDTYEAEPIRKSTRARLGLSQFIAQGQQNQPILLPRVSCHCYYPIPLHPPLKPQKMHLLRHLLRHLPSTLHTRLLSSTSTPSPTLISSLLSSLSQFSSPDADPSSFRSHFLLHYSDVTLTTPLLSSLLSPSPSSPSLSRSPLLLFSYLITDRSFSPSDHSLSLLIAHLSSRHDYSPIPSLLSSHPSAAGPLSFRSLSLSLIRSSRPSDAVSLFLSLPNLFPSLPKSKPLFLPLLSSLADHKFPSHAECLVKSSARHVFPDQQIRDELIRAYSNSLKLTDSKRLAKEMARGGFDLTTTAHNHLLDCVCRLARNRDPVKMKPEAVSFLSQMDADSVPRDSETFRVLIYNLCKIRMTEDAVLAFRKMGEWNCSPCQETYLVLVRSLYQAARVTEGDEMVGWMRAAGFGDRLDRKAYYGFIKILCGIERVDHAMKVFRMMKGYGHAPGVKSYDLLIEKLAEHNQVDRAKALFKEARARGVEVAEREYRVDPRFAKKKEKKEKKRETLPEKMKKKRRRLKRLRLSFVRKPKKQRRLA